MFKTISTTLRKSYSTQASLTQKTINDIHKLYRSKIPISMVTAHDYITATFANDADTDMVLIGDSLAMVALGHKDTTKIQYDEFLYMARSVSRAVETPFLIADLPFGSFESSVSKGIESCINLVKNGGNIQAVKIEGCDGNLELISRIVQIGIPVMGHLGLTPQKVNALSGYKVQANGVDSSIKLLQDCLKLQKAGCFSIVLEAIPHKIAEHITNTLSIPTIGIGAGPGCSGQVLVMADLLGMNKPRHKDPKFLKKYNNFYQQAVESIQNYNNDLKDRKFPEVGNHTYNVKAEIYDEYLKLSRDIKQ